MPRKRRHCCGRNWYEAETGCSVLVRAQLCRSQMAEALGKLLAGDVFESCSAGTHPVEAINRDAVRLMKAQYGVDMEATQHSKGLSDLPPVDVVVTMGCNVQWPQPSVQTAGRLGPGRSDR